MKQLITTKHSAKRIEERVGIKGKVNIKKHVSKIYKNGHRACEVERGLKDYISRKIEKNYRRAKVVRIKKGFIYFFTYDCVLLTVIEIPKRFGRWN